MPSKTTQDEHLAGEMHGGKKGKKSEQDKTKKMHDVWLYSIKGVLNMWNAVARIVHMIRYSTVLEQVAWGGNNV
jgi:hypothetical protein